MMIQPVILCGGSGSRLWPLSRADFPKQFIEYDEDETGIRSLFKSACARVNVKELAKCEVNKPIIIATNEHKFIIKNQLNNKEEFSKLLLEPIGRNTAASVTMAALECTNKDAILIVLPSDQALDTSELRKSIEKAIPEAISGRIVLLGVVPTKAATGYGYIETISSPDTNDSLRKVISFCEKPNLNKAKEFLEKGGYYWNAGIFILKSSVWLEMINRYRLDIYRACLLAYSKRIVKDKTVLYSFNEYKDIPSESVDYAVLEKIENPSDKIRVVPFNGIWTDLGSWDSIQNFLASITRKDCFSKGDVYEVNSERSLFISTSRLVVANNISDIAVIETPDAVLVSSLKHSQNVKKIVDYLKIKQRPEALKNRKVYRPWGYYDSLDEDVGFKVKRIVVHPGQRLSLQLHHHRAEHWIVTHGTALVQIGETEQIVSTNQSIFIPKGVKHRLNNTTNQDLYLIEVQTGDYLGEDDIERFEDIYGRV